MKAKKFEDIMEEVKKNFYSKLNQTKEHTTPTDLDQKVPPYGDTDMDWVTDDFMINDLIDDMIDAMREEAKCV